MRHNYLSADLAGEIGGQNRHVVLFGQVGSGKTSIFNLLVSHSKDIKRGGKEKFGPIVGSCRLGHIGEVTLIDTAGLNDVSELDGENATSVRNTVRRAVCKTARCARGLHRRCAHTGRFEGRQPRARCRWQPCERGI